MDPIGKNTLDVMSEASWYNKWLYDYFKKYIHGDILEVGGGIGNFVDLLKKRGNLTSIDINIDYLKKLRNGKNIDAGFGDIEKGKYFFKNKKYDSIICFNVLEHINDDKKALKNMNKLLKKGGKLILLVPAYQFLYSKLDKEIGHFRRYTLKEIDKKIKNVGFKKIKSNYLNWWSVFGWLIFVKLLNGKSMPSAPVKIFDFFGKLMLFPEKIITSPFGLSVISVSEKK